MPEREGECLSPLGRAFLGGPDETRRALHRVRHPDRQRLSALPAELAGARPRHLVLRPPRRDDARAGRAGRSGHPASRTGSASRPPIRISISCRRSSPGSTASSTSSIRGRRTTTPTTRSGRCCRRACRRRSTRSSASRCSARNSETCSSTISSSSSATRPAGSRNGSRMPASTPGDEPTEWEQNEYFDFF